MLRTVWSTTKGWHLEAIKGGDTLRWIRHERSYGRSRLKTRTSTEMASTALGGGRKIYGLKASTGLPGLLMTQSLPLRSDKGRHNQRFTPVFNAKILKSAPCLTHTQPEMCINICKHLNKRESWPGLSQKPPLAPRQSDLMPGMFLNRRKQNPIQMLLWNQRAGPLSAAAIGVLAPRI